MFGVKFYLILLNRNVKLPDYLPILNHYKNQLKRGGSMVQGQVFLKKGGEPALFLFNFFKVYHLEIALPFAKLSYAFEEKKNFLPP